MAPVDELKIESPSKGSSGATSLALLDARALFFVADNVVNAIEVQGDNRFRRHGFHKVAEGHGVLILVDPERHTLSSFGGTLGLAMALAARARVVMRDGTG